MKKTTEYFDSITPTTSDRNEAMYKEYMSTDTTFKKMEEKYSLTASRIRSIVYEVHVRAKAWSKEKHNGLPIFSVRTANCLKLSYNKDFVSAEELYDFLLKHDNAQLLRMPNFGRKSLAELRDWQVRYSGNNPHLPVSYIPNTTRKWEEVSKNTVFVARSEKHQMTSTDIDYLYRKMKGMRYSFQVYIIMDDKEILIQDFRRTEGEGW